MPARVAVIGAGALGLMGLKNLLDEGFDATAYETRAYVGGLWKYSDDSGLSAAENTVFNSSIHRSAISDFPFSDDTDSFPTADQLYRYLKSYCDHFGLRSHIQFSTSVLGVWRENETWALEIKPHKGETRIEYYDKVLVANGSFTKPKTPHFEGIEKFSGATLHAMNYHQPSDFQGKRVLVIGLHASASDVTVSLSKYASKAYISHRVGVVMIARYTPEGAAFDEVGHLWTMFFEVLLSTWFPRLHAALLDTILASWSRKAFPDVLEKWHLSPFPSAATTTPMIADELYTLMTGGFAEPVDEVHKVTGPKSVELTDGRVLDDIDAIIYCTGYDFAVPFLADKYNPYPVGGKPSKLYRNIFPLHPDEAVRNSLAFLGQVAIPLPGFVQHELVAMAVVQVWTGKSQLPPLSNMQDWHQRYLAWRIKTAAAQKVKSAFYVVWVPMADHLTWLDRMAGTGMFENFGWFSREAWAFWWRDGELYRKCMTGLFSPAMWRLFDMGKRKAWGGAREQIFKDNELAERRAKQRLQLKSD